MVGQDERYFMPEETSEHQSTWIQWPHNYLYGPYYRDDVSPTFVAMTNALQSSEKVNIIAYDETELAYIQNQLELANVPFENLAFLILKTDDVWSRDNGPIFVYDQNSTLHILDWGFNGWGNDTPYELCDVVPQSISSHTGIPLIDLNEIVLEGGAIEHDGHGTMMATRSSVVHESRNPDFTEEEIEEYLSRYLGFDKFIWLDGVYGADITDQHIDGFVKFANDSTIVTMSEEDLEYWLCPPQDIQLLYEASNVNDERYRLEFLPLTQNNVVSTYGNNLGFKGSYVNYYIANEVVVVPTYNDPNDDTAIEIIQRIHPDRSVVGVDVRNLYAYGGMIHCITQQQPVALATNVQRIDSEEISFSIHPNPFSEQSTITLPPRHKCTRMEIMNLHGQLLRLIHIENGENEIFIRSEGLTDGVYVINAYSGIQLMDSQNLVISR